MARCLTGREVYQLVERLTREHFDDLVNVGWYKDNVEAFKEISGYLIGARVLYKNGEMEAAIHNLLEARLLIGRSIGTG